MLAIRLLTSLPPLALHVSQQKFSSVRHFFTSVGNAFGTQVAGLLSHNLNDIVGSIDGHGNTVKEALRVEQVFRAEEQLEAEAKQELEDQGLESAMHDMISAITNSRDKLSDAVEKGHNEVSLSITRGNDKLADAVTTGHDKVSSAVASGSDQLSSSLDSGHQKISTSVLTAGDSINDVADAIEVCMYKKNQSVQTSEPSEECIFFRTLELGMQTL